LSNRGQFDEDDANGFVFCDSARDLESEPRLADPAWADQRHQAGAVAEPLLQRLNVSFPANKVRHRYG
jgi:hypothetical protein